MVVEIQVETSSRWKIFQGLVDPGSVETLIKSKIVLDGVKKQIEAKTVKKNQKLKFGCLDSKLKTKYNDKVCELTAFVFDDMDFDFLLGVDWCQKLGANFNWDKMSISFDSNHD
jgi:hypothetical protein